MYCMYGARDRARTPHPSGRGHGRHGRHTFRMRPEDHGSRPMPEMCWNVAQMTFLAHETLHMSSLDPTNGMLCVGCAQDTLGGALGRSWGVLWVESSRDHFWYFQPNRMIRTAEWTFAKLFLHVSELDHSDRYRVWHYHVSRSLSLPGFGQISTDEYVVNRGVRRKICRSYRVQYCIL